MLNLSWLFQFVITINILFLVACGGTGTEEPVITVDPPPQSIGVEKGCYSNSYNGANSSQIGCGLINTFGNASFDQRFFEEIQIQNSYWGLNTAVYAFDECQGKKNALSFPDGYILFGRNMVYDVILSTNSEIPVAGVLAHEFAHQIQFAYGWQNNYEPTVRRTELEADAFSGFYLAMVKASAGAEIGTYFDTLFNIGDYQFNNAGHHGTPTERRAAGIYGLEVAFQSMSTGYLYSYQELHSLFGNFKANFLDKNIEQIVKLDQKEISIPWDRAQKLKRLINGEIGVEKFDYDIKALPYYDAQTYIN